METNKKSVLFILISNLFPVLGILFLEWDYLNVVFLYIIETVWIGLINIVRLSLTTDYFHKSQKTGQIEYLNQDSETKPGQRKFIKIFVPVFFLFHYMAFVAIQTFLVVALIGQLDRESFHNILSIDFVLNAIVILGVHVWIFKKNEYDTKKVFEPLDLKKAMAQPYKRIFIQQFFVILGSFLFLLFGFPPILAIVLIAIKLAVDLKFFWKVSGRK